MKIINYVGKLKVKYLIFILMFFEQNALKFV